MMPNPYRVFGNPTPQMLGRSRLAERVLDRLRTQHVSVVGPRFFGKTVFLTGIAKADVSKQHFSDVVYWDLRHLTPANDGEFFAAMADVLRNQVRSCGNDATDYFSSPENKTAQAIVSFFDYLKDQSKRVLLIMDGMDQPLSSENLSPSVWDNLCAITERNSVSMLTASRKRLRQLCVNPNSRTSDFWQRFVDPVVELRALTREELQAFIKPLADHVGTIASGADTEIWNWSGGLPLLAAAICEHLLNTVKAGGGLSTAQVVEAAAFILAERGDVVEALWQEFETEIQTAFLDLVQRAELNRNELSGVAGRLVVLGLAQENGNRLKPHARLMAEHSAGRREGLAAMTVLFSKPQDFERNMRALVELRLGHVAIQDADLRDFITNTIEKVAQPRVCLTGMRSIAEHALGIIWKAESANGEVPRFTSDRGLRFIQQCENNRLPTDLARQCQCLDLLTDSRNGVSPRKVNRKIFCLVNFLKSLGDLGQHQGGVQVDLAFSAKACLSAIQLADELVRAGLA
jgi:hypothetical protein